VHRIFLSRDGRFVAQGQGEAITLPDQHARHKDRAGAEPDRVADALGAKTPGAAAIAMANRVHGDARLAGLASRTGGAPPGLPAADQRRLAGAALERPALGAAGGATTGTFTASVSKLLITLINSCFQ